MEESTTYTRCFLSRYWNCIYHDRIEQTFSSKYSTGHSNYSHEFSIDWNIPVIPLGTWSYSVIFLMFTLHPQILNPRWIFSGGNKKKLHRTKFGEYEECCSCTIPCFAKHFVQQISWLASFFFSNTDSFRYHQVIIEILQQFTRLHLNFEIFIFWIQTSVLILKKKKKKIFFKIKLLISVF